jgi:malate dehydrogenase
VSQPTPAGDWFSVAVPSRGQYGVPEGLVFSYPVTSDGRTCAVVDGITHDAFGREQLARTIDELASEREAVRGLLGD